VRGLFLGMGEGQNNEVKPAPGKRMDFRRSECCKWRCIMRSAIYPRPNSPTNSFEEAVLPRGPFSVGAASRVWGLKGFALGRPLPGRFDLRFQGRFSKPNNPARRGEDLVNQVVARAGAASRSR
jgi:hypothetical protein